MHLQQGIENLIPKFASGCNDFKYAFDFIRFFFGNLSFQLYASTISICLAIFLH